MEKMAHKIALKAPGKIRLSWELISVVSILVLGLFLRIYKIKSYIVFLGDEGRDVLVVYNILHGDLTLLGPTSSVGGFFLGPIYYYLMAPFLWLSKYDPVGPAVMVVLFGLATIYLVYVIGKEFFGKIAGLVASLLYAVSPIVIIYSRSSWNPNVFPFFTLSSLYMLYLGIKKKKWYLFALSGFLMGINLQIHYLATFVGVIMFIYLTFVEFKLKKEWFKNTIKRYAIMLFGFLIGFSPFFAFEARHQFLNTKNIIKFIFDSSDTGLSGNIFMNVEVVFERLFGGLLISFPGNVRHHMFDPDLIMLWYLATVVFGIILIGFFLYYFYKNFKSKEVFQKTFLILIWGVVGIGLFLFYKKPVYDYYLGFLFPFPFLLVGLVASEVIKKYKKVGGIVVVCITSILLIINLKFSPILTPGNNQVDQMRSISEFILSKTNNEHFNFALITGGNSDHAYRYFFRLADKDPVVIENSIVDPDRNTVTDQLFVVCESLPCKPLGNSLWEIAGFGRAEIADEWDVSVVKIYRLIPYSKVE